MDDMEEKLGAILGNPQMMQQIMSMAQALGQSQPQPQQEPPRQFAPTMSMDPAMLQRIGSLMRQSGIDKNQQALLKALSPYLSRDRISKLEKAMRSAKIAAMASTVLRNSGTPFYAGR